MMAMVGKDERSRYMGTPTGKKERKQEGKKEVADSKVRKNKKTIGKIKKERPKEILPVKALPAAPFQPLAADKVPSVLRG